MSGQGAHDHGKMFHGGPERLWSPGRLAILERERVVGLCREGVRCTSVLDVGTGAGVFAETFVKSGIRVTGIDPSLEFLAAARAAVPGADFREGTAEHLPFGDGAFDLVFLALVLHETDNPIAALSEARRVAAVRVAVLEWPYTAEEMGPGIEHRFEPGRLDEMARTAGFAGVRRLTLSRLELYLLSPRPGSPAK